MSNPDTIARELVRTVVEAEEAQARADRLGDKAIALGRELSAHMPANVLTLACEVGYEDVVVQLTREANGDVLPKRIETTRISQVDWLAPNDPAPTRADLDLAASDAWSSHTINPTFDALTVAEIDVEVH